MSIWDRVEEVRDGVRQRLKPRASEGYILGPEDELFGTYEDIALQMEEFTGRFMEDRPELRVWYDPPDDAADGFYHRPSNTVCVREDVDEPEGVMARQLGEYLLDGPGLKDWAKDRVEEFSDIRFSMVPEQPQYLRDGFVHWLADRTVTEYLNDREKEYEFDDVYVTVIDPVEDTGAFVGRTFYDVCEQECDDRSALELGLGTYPLMEDEVYTAIERNTGEEFPMAVVRSFFGRSSR